MANTVWNGHLHFGLVVMPVRLLVAARPKTTRFRRLHRKPSKPLMRFPWPSTGEDDDSYSESPNDSPDNHQPSIPETAYYDYAPVRQVFQSEASGEEIRPDELVKGYEYAPNEFAAI